MDILKIEFGVKDIPVFFNVDIGQTTPIFVFPLGCKMMLDPISKIMTLVEDPFYE